MFEYQRAQNPVYAEYLRLIGKATWAPADWTQIPCLPISMFRTHDVRTGDWSPETTFRSSGTSAPETSRMPVRDLANYQRHARGTFENLIGPLSEFRLLALLPNYLERGDSGLVAMIDDFMRAAASGSGYFLHDFAALQTAIDRSLAEGQPVLLWGVTFALLDFASHSGTMVLPEGSLVMETGGMKGRGPELTRDELHGRLRAAFGKPIYSEYGMTELSSQAYLGAEGVFRSPPTMRLLARDLTDPFCVLPPGSQGALNVYDLANVDTCAFIATDDLGRLASDGGVQVLGRVDASVVRGCNLLVG